MALLHKIDIPGSALSYEATVPLGHITLQWRSCNPGWLLRFSASSGYVVETGMRGYKWATPETLIVNAYRELRALGIEPVWKHKVITEGNVSLADMAASLTEKGKTSCQK